MLPEERTPLRLAFIGGATNSAVGYTHFASSHLDGYFKLAAGVFSRTDETNRAAGRTYEVEAHRVHGDWRSLLAAERGRVDAVVVLTPTPSHAEIVIEALRAGHAVICEKALATSREECLAIHDAAQRSGNFMAVTFNYSGYAMVRELAAMLRSGRLGELQQIHIEMPQEGFARRIPGVAPTPPQAWRLCDYRVPTISLDLGVHVHHLVHYVSGGRRPLQVAARQTSFGNFRHVVDDVRALVRYEGGLEVDIWYSKSAIGYRNGLRMRVFGSEGSAEWLQVEPERLQLAYCDGRREQIDLGSGGLQVAAQARYNRFKPGHPSGFIEAFANLYADIADALHEHLAGAPRSNPNVFGADHAAEGLALLEAIDGAARSASWQAVETAPRAASRREGKHA